MAEEAGTDYMRDFYRDLGFFDRLETDLGLTARPLVPEPWRPISTVTTSYGHGIAVTPLHVVDATLRIVAPETYKGLAFIKERNGNKENIKPVVNDKTAETMKRLMRLAVRVGTGSNADVSGYLVGGKTATAEKVQGRGYSQKALMTSFVGIYPSDNPKTLVFVMMDEPKGQKESFGFATAGWTAAPVVARIIERITALRGETRYVQDGAYDPSDALVQYLPDKIVKELAQSD